MFALGKKARGICDVCSFEYLLKDLKYEVVAGKRTKRRVCRYCNDPDNPRDRPAVWTSKPEAIAVRDPRPDISVPGMNSLVGWGPVLGIEIPVVPVADGFSMMLTTNPLPMYLRTETGFRLKTEDGKILQEN